MKVSLKWLKDYVDISVPLGQVVERLTMAGLEVSEARTIGGDWKNVVVGRIVGVSPHPNADRLRLVTVDLGKQQSTVVCGAPNLTVGDKVAFAHVGARLIDGHDGKVAELKPARIRGVVSEGMVCSEKELGISESHEGILVLLPDAPVGAPLSEYIGDTIIDLEVTPNRPDCLSVIGIAREIAALTGRDVEEPEARYDEAGEAIESLAAVKISEPELCPRYVASLITGVRVAPSPRWLQQRLVSCGMRPINNIVDVTNYVMLEYGQPLHAFDFDQIRGRQIIVRLAGEEESITSLDGAARILSHKTLVIADTDRAVAVAGIMGGLDTEVTSDTTSVLIESANFNQAVIRRGGSHLRLSSEASLRFEKGLSRELPLVALKRATRLMHELAGGKVAKGVIDVYPGKLGKKPLLLSADEVERLLGMKIPPDEIAGALRLLGFHCEHSGSSIRVDVPWWRTDISCTADLVEEVARVTGYDNIPTAMLSGSLSEQQSLPVQRLREKLRNELAACGFHEALTYSLSNVEIMTRLSPERCPAGVAPIKVANPMSMDYECLRTSLRAGLLSALARNEKHEETGIRLFEIGRVFLPRGRELPEEREMLCAVMNDVPAMVSWRGKPETIDFFAAKGVVEAVFVRLGLSVSFRASDDETLCPGRRADIDVGAERLGIVGEVHPKVSEAFELSGSTYMIEMDLGKLNLVAGKYQPIIRYPATARDIALLADEQTAYQQVYDIIRDCPVVSEVTLFDLYRGKQVPPGKKSFAFRIVYQSSTHTFTDKEVDEVQQQLLDRLSQELGVTLRG